MSAHMKLNHLSAYVVRMAFIFLFEKKNKNGPVAGGFLTARKSNIEEGSVLENLLFYQVNPSELSLFFFAPALHIN